MLSLNLLRKSRKIAASTSPARLDGYSAQAARFCCLFQTYVESEVDCDYDALRLALVWARTTDYPVNLYTLRAKYQDARYSSASYATRTH